MEGLLSMGPTLSVFNCDLKQVLIQKWLNSIDLSATHETFVKKGEFKSTFLLHTYKKA